MFSSISATSSACDPTPLTRRAVAIISFLIRLFPGGYGTSRSPVGKLKAGHDRTSLVFPDGERRALGFRVIDQLRKRAFLQDGTCRGLPTLPKLVGWRSVVFVQDRRAIVWFELSLA